MVCKRFTSLILGLLLSLAALGGSTATTHQELVALANTHHAIGGNNKELQIKDEVMTRRKLLRGRKMGVEEKVNMEMNTGKNVDSSSKIASSSQNGKAQETKSSVQRLETQGKASEPIKSPVADPTEVSPQSTKNLQQATEELYNLLSEDYHSRGRRRAPIHNSHPLKEADVDDP
ncbi:uncharacterized protein LOC109833850 [Asparagus officinalis]|uniref:uncharacterized protein LOC109833850 n=1 Tax=Asparagus officinalis TaxID=4686 RepID=UPI00098E1F36|nr:uncharacterized protein LOC109833850 [Asparagus officinalis]